MWMPRVYQHERRIVFGGSGNQRAVSIDAYNKISPDATGTVYQDTKTIANTDAHANGDELWIHFTTPVVEAARLVAP